MLTIELSLAGYLNLGIYFVVLQVILLVAMIKVLTTNPGILPQIVYRYNIHNKDVNQMKIFLKFLHAHINNSIDT